MTDNKLETAIYDIQDQYEEALHLGFVKKPMAYALYQTWKKWDAKEKPKERENK